MSDENTTTAPEMVETMIPGTNGLVSILEPAPTAPRSPTPAGVAKAPKAPKQPAVKPTTTAKSEAKKPTPKKTPTPKSKEKTVPATAAPKKSAPKPTTAKDKDREAAKAADLNLVHYRVLRALVKAGKPLSYRGIEKVTGYYSTLTKVLRDTHDNSLCSLGLAKEEVDADNTLTFVATAKGRKVFEK